MVRVRLTVGLLLLAPSIALAQNQHAQVYRPIHQDVSPPLRDIPPGLWRLGEREAEPVKPIPSPRHAPGGPDAAVQGRRFGPVAGQAPTASLSTDGLGNGFPGFNVMYAPPDNNGAVGATQFVETVNVGYAVFDKKGAVVLGPIPISTLWAGFGGGCESNDDGDPTVVYDRIANRWVISQFSVSSLPYLQCVAVSTTSDATGSYYRYAYSYGNTQFNDYPKMGVWPDGYYITYNIFNNGRTFAGSKVCVLDRVRMLTGAPANQQCFQTTTTYGGLLPADLDGSTLPPAGAVNPVVALGATSGQLALWKFHVDWANPANTAFTGPVALAVSPYTEPSGTVVSQPGTMNKLDTLGDRLMFRAAYRNFGDHESLVVNHSVALGGSLGVRWYELRGATGNPTVYQQSTFAPDATFRWMGSVAMDMQGNMALGYSASSSTLKPSVRYTGRLAGDPLHTMTQGETTVVPGGGSQTGTLTRWGDYTSMSVDPGDDCTFWYTNQYLKASGTFNWSTRFTAFKFPSCGTTTSPADFALSATPTSSSVSKGTAASYNVSVNGLNNYKGTVAFSISGLPTGAGANFSPTESGTSTVLTVDTTNSVTGTFTLTITGTDTADSSLTHSTTVTITVQPAVQPSFTLTPNPASRSVTRGGSATYAIAIARSGGFAGAVTLSASGVPGRTTASFSPNGTTGNSSTLTIATAKNSARGTYTITVTGTGPGVQNATTTVQITIN